MTNWCRIVGLNARSFSHTLTAGVSRTKEPQMSSKSRPRTGRSWYGVKTLYRSSALGRPKATDRSYDPWVTMVEERVVLFKTRSSSEDIRAAAKEARAYA